MPNAQFWFLGDATVSEKVYDRTTKISDGKTTMKSKIVTSTTEVPTTTNTKKKAESSQPGQNSIDFVSSYRQMK